MVTGTKSRPKARAAARMPEAAVGTARRDGSGHREVGVLLARVAVHVRRREPVSRELGVQQHPRAGAPLPVHVADGPAGEVRDVGQAEGVARRDEQALLAPDQPDDADPTALQQPVDVRQGVVARLRVEQVRAGEVAQPVPQGHQAAERAHVGRGEADPRVAGAQRGGGQVEHQVVRPDHHDRPPDLVQPAQQLDLDLLAGLVALGRGGDDEQAVGPHQRGEHARPAGERGRHDPPATWPSRTRTQSSMPSTEASLRARCACVTGRRRGAAPSSAARRGATKMSKVSAADTG